MIKYYSLNLADHSVVCLGEAPEAAAAAFWGDASPSSGCIWHSVNRSKFDFGEVSTVFLGLDHRSTGSGPPLVFETMIFSDIKEIDGYQSRSSSWEEAEKMHEIALELLHNAYQQRQAEIVEKFYANKQ